MAADPPDLAAPRRCDHKSRRGRRCKNRAAWRERHDPSDLERFLCSFHHMRAALASFEATCDGKPDDGWWTIGPLVPSKKEAPF